MEASAPSKRVRFGKFEVDLESGELFKDSHPVHLLGQPIQILLMLLEKPGQVVTREELQKRLWPEDTFVDFDHGLNVAIQRLREFLNDSADLPRYVATVPRRGYRFICPVNRSLSDAQRPPISPSPSWIARAWSLMTQSPASPPPAQGEAVESIRIESPVVEVSPGGKQPENLRPNDAGGEEAQWLTEAHLTAESPKGTEAQGIAKGLPLRAGQRLGQYEVLSLLGKGGMGVVYCAEDTNLSRQVAIKVLYEEFASDFERLARFEREAKLLASLNHPNISAIYGLDQSAGRRFFVLELVEGETLAERLSQGALSIEESLEVCRQIAEGVEVAHEKGIIHRDLKPANVKITPEGKVKILDFGLAKVLEIPLTSGAYPSGKGRPQWPSMDNHSTTPTEEIDGPGVVLGTATYMSPEQATGKPVDKRTDIWAFGCIFFECLTGRGAFERESVTNTLSAILKGEPDWQALPAATPRSVKHLLPRCLHKDPKQRLRDIGDARIEIADALNQPPETDSVPQRISRPWPFGMVAGGVIAGLLIGSALTWHFRPVASYSVVRSAIKMEPGHWLEGMRLASESEGPTRTAFVISRDGCFIVYSAVEGGPTPQGRSQLFIRWTNQEEAKPISGTEGAISPFLSPDDHWLGFWVKGKLMKVPIDGGVPVHLCDGAMPFGASWGPDNSIVFSPDKGSGISRVSSDGGKPEVITTPDKAKEEYSHRLPYFLPNGKGVVFTIMGELFDLHPRIGLLNLKTRKWGVLLEDAADARYVPTGHLAFLRQGTLMAAPFDLGRLVVTGQPFPLTANVMQALNYLTSEFNTGAGQFGLSDTGWLVYVAGGILPDAENRLVWVDLKGNELQVALFKAPLFVPRLSPDGLQIAYSSIGREWRTWIYDLHRGTNSRLPGEGKEVFVTWTPDSKRVLFGWWRSGRPNLYSQSADGSSPMEQLTRTDYGQLPGPITPDGAILAFVEDRPDTGWDINLLDLKSLRVTPFLNSRANENYPEISPDGRWMAYVSDESDRREIYVRPFPGPGGKWQVSNDGGEEPLWAKSGRQLFYRRGNEVWLVEVRTDGGFKAGRPRFLFERPGYDLGVPLREWDISPDGQRFLMVKLGEKKPQPVAELILVQNWFEELKRLAPVGMK